MDTGDALALCERGRWSEILDLIPASDTRPESLLVQGYALVFTQPEAAKDILSRAVRDLPEGELKEKSQIWLAVSYWSIGEAAEARHVLDTISPSTISARFLKGLNASIFQSEKLDRSIAALDSIADLIDLVQPLYKAKFYNQRAWLMRRLKRVDAAIIDYETARYWFQIADAPRYLAAATSNVAALLIDTKRFEDAHRSVDSAIEALHKSDTLFLAQVYDHKALIFIAEGQYEAAEDYAQQSVDLLTRTENRALLAESLVTHARALRRLDQHTKALVQLERAKDIAKYLGSKSLLLNVSKEQKETAQALTQKAHIEMVEIALDLSGESLRGAARLVGVKAQPLDRFIRLHKIKRHPKVRKSIITKPRN